MPAVGCAAVAPLAAIRRAKLTFPVWIAAIGTFLMTVGIAALQDDNTISKSMRWETMKMMMILQWRWIIDG